ncbi:MAG: mannose-1-phosphate guanyltransferase [Bdellovibrionales bacterium CG10_big_fil_rev_8_21_14_0_10_45_34]|nr:MAG: mannose-1-phosphate guanyltransferase [Bdellovibrionales bacterium CG10_big_fil_rev_8_21_14_0_10_45_34]
MKAVILAGGLGKRLRPLTQAIPKPLLPIGEKSIMEIQITNLVRQGVDEIYIATNYMADYVESFLGDGSRYGAKLIFSKEKEPLGTCGPLTLLRDKLTEPFVVMNGDILTSVDFHDLIRFAEKEETLLTVATKQIRTPFNFGSVEVKDNRVVSVEEKPDFLTEIIAGIYYFRPELLEQIPSNTFFGMDHLILRLIASHTPITRYLIEGFWLDIGRMDDYEHAQIAYSSHFKDDLV